MPEKDETSTSPGYDRHGMYTDKPPRPPLSVDGRTLNYGDEGYDKALETAGRHFDDKCKGRVG